MLIMSPCPSTADVEAAKVVGVMSRLEKALSP